MDVIIVFFPFFVGVEGENKTEKVFTVRDFGLKAH